MKNLFHFVSALFNGLGKQFNDLDGTFRRASTATDTQRVVDARKMVFHLRRRNGTYLLADTATDTAGGTYRFGLLARVVRRATHLYGRVVGNHRDDVLGTDRRALSATDTLVLVHHRDTVNERNGIVRAYRYAGAETVTGKGASLARVAGGHRRLTAIPRTVIVR